MAMHGSRRWTVAFGVWWGVPVRLHLMLVLFVVVAAALTVDGSFSNGLVTVVVLVGSLALHEVAHCLAAVRLGGKAEGVVLSPIGGLQAPKVPDEPEPQLLVALVGPLMNLGVVLTATTGLLAAGVLPVELLSLFNPISPRGMLEGAPLMVAAKEAVWINWMLLLLNALPAYPFDGRARAKGGAVAAAGQTYGGRRGGLHGAGDGGDAMRGRGLGGKERPAGGLAALGPAGDACRVLVLQRPA